jgi:hypothetical protein
MKALVTGKPKLRESVNAFEEMFSRIAESQFTKRKKN